MKILYIADNINAPDGSAVHCRSFVSSVTRAGHEIRTYPSISDNYTSFDLKHLSEKEKIKYYLRNPSLSLLIKTPRKVFGYVPDHFLLAHGFIKSIKTFFILGKLVITYKPDLIIFRYKIFMFSTFWICKLYKIPFLLEINALKSMEERLSRNGRKISFVIKGAERAAIRSAKYAFTVSKQISDHIVQQSPGLKSYVIPNGVDTDHFDPTRYDKEAGKERLGLKGKTVLGYVGSYKVWHGLDIAIRIIEILVKHNPKYKLVLIGNGQCYGQINNQIRSRKLEDCVKQITYISHKSIPEYMACFDYALMCYPIIEPFYFSPLKVFEYMSMSIPVFATAIGQIREIISDGKNGILVYPPTAENFAETIITTDNNKKILKSIFKDSRKTMIENYTWDINARKIISVCYEIIHSGHNNSGQL